jgi:trk system potassium uptake protein TrkA
MARSKVFAVFGLGTFGEEVCRTLVEKGAKVIAVDHTAQLVDKIKDAVEQAVLLDSTDEDALRQLPLSTVDAAVVAIGENLSASILTVALLKKLGVPYIVARAISEIHSQILKQVGAAEVIIIEVDEGRRVASRLISPDVVDRIPISTQQTLAEVLVPKSFAGSSLHKLELRKRFNVNVISIRRTRLNVDNMGNPVKEEVVLSPQPQDVIQENDVLVVVGPDRAIDALKES